ncbi:hypothetical protein B0J12DRAFT_437098 [Macrophomina phaseolina]|uniref:BTB domain-containing protein n=1 Tax=Macrophomina phaseolina TaxID=35725 RepID=A0ABQ8GHK1_9PEZI|nr:hypothetical protein B0J12DRAFT_437098 [Macrophomina phaseolina]
MARESLFGAPPTTPASPDVNKKEAQPEAGPVIISAGGDVLLRVKEDDDKEGFLYRVESTRLRAASSYFEKLLSGSFSEASHVSVQHDQLRKQYPSMADVPLDQLPEVTIVDIGRTSKVSTIKLITADFLRALHEQALGNGKDAPPVTNMANLAIVADRFDALATFSRFVHRRKYLQMMDAKAKGKTAATLTEERVRQKLLIGTLLDHPPWIQLYSKKLILSGSARWKKEALDESGGALWWDIPSGIEDELIFRRSCILDTINSLQSHFIKLYTSGQRQCRLGYDSSAQCDVYQLGEMIRFFTRIGTLRLDSAICDSDSTEGYHGDISRLLDSLRQCPSYQIDKNHSHCGLRTKMIPLLDHLQSCLGGSATPYDSGICGECWRERRAEYAWSQAKRPVLWSIRSAAPRPGPREPHTKENCLRRHAAVRDMFTAAEHDWSAADNAAVRPFGTWAVDRMVA